MEVLDFSDAPAFEAWLIRNQDSSMQGWLRIAKKHSGINTLTIADALDVALCHGWIDGQRRALDDVSFLQRYCPRRPSSSWSRVNVAKVEALQAAGRMRAGGLREVAAAKADGRWELAYESQRTATPPADLLAALAADERAEAAFGRLGRSGQYAVILPLLKATSPQARAKVLARELTRLAEQDS